MKKREQYRHSKDMEVTIKLKTGKRKIQKEKQAAKGNIEKEAMFFKRVINTTKYHNNFTTFIN